MTGDEIEIRGLEYGTTAIVLSTTVYDTLLVKKIVIEVVNGDLEKSFTNIEYSPIDGYVLRLEPGETFVPTVQLKESGITAFFTRSSAANIPVNMRLCEDLGLDEKQYSVSIPLGATINMAGNAIYYALLAIFFAQFYGIDLSMADYVSITVVCTLGAIGQAGVPGPTLLAAAVLVAAGIPLEGLPLFYALDRIFDMIRTTLNITGDAACAAVVDRFVNKDSGKIVQRAEE